MGLNISACPRYGFCLEMHISTDELERAKQSVIDFMTQMCYTVNKCSLH